MMALWRGPWRERRCRGSTMAEQDVDVVDISDFDTVERSEFARFVADGWPARGAYDMVQRRRAIRAARAAQATMQPEGGEGQDG